MGFASDDDDDFYYHYTGGDNANNDAAGAAPKRAVKSGWHLAVAYLVAWVIILVIFRIVYVRYRRTGRKKTRRGAGVGQHSDAWFGPHKEREAYEQLLLSLTDDSKTPAADDQAAAEETLRKALLRRAMTDLRRAWKLQEEKEPVYKLMRSGAIGEGMWGEFKEAESAMQIEIFDLQAEAETFKAGWGKEILRDAAGLIKRERELQTMRVAIEQREQERARQGGAASEQATRQRVSSASSSG